MQINKPVAIILLFIITGMVAVLFAIPKYQEYRAVQNQILQKEAQLSGQSVYYARVADMMAQLRARQDALDTVDSALPADFSLAPVVSFLQAEGAQNGVAVQSVAFSKNSSAAIDQAPEAPVAGQVKDTSFTVTASGSYSGLKGFLAGMDNSARIFEVDTISFAPADAAAPKNSSTQYLVKLEVRTHSY